jgi:uncharacterized membrane protein
MNRRLIFSILETILSIGGTGVAGTLYWAHRSGVQLPCSTGDGCDLVNSSHWAIVAGVPLSLIGTAGYVVLLFCSVIKATSDDQQFQSRIRWLMTALTAVGAAYSWYLQYVAHVYIGAFCIYCRTSAFIMTLLFLTLCAEQLCNNKKSFNLITSEVDPV